ncbi:efflux RND transporter periplasmic adaptor subunit [Desulfonatronovibrio magnus]|uniref:efflux RND transporter periplasmic adaptor subunit n=1 Tax=Desulfonatronovibrio magnus TaxID=698827 RepID=UPI0005EB6623|nr:efflux RND transporter periplasmic adaptor subunit [Desulfonatronovibrio magnus]
MKQFIVKNKIIISISATILFLLLIYTSFSDSSTPSSQILTTPAIKTDMVVEVRTVGELDAANSIVLSSSVRGDRGKIIYLVEDGKHVEESDVLVRLDPSVFEEEVIKLRSRVIELDTLVDAQDQLLQWEKNQVEREITRAESDLQIARLELRRLEKGEGPRELARLEAEANRARDDYDQKLSFNESLEELSERGFANPTEQAQIKKMIDESRQAYTMVAMQLESYRDHLLPVQLEKARAAITAAEVNLEQTKVGGGYKIGQAMAALERSEQELQTARQSLNTAQQELSATVIRAPGPGMVVLAEQIRGNTNRKPRVGDQVWQNQPLVYLPDISRMIVNTQVRETDLHKIDVGKLALARVDAYPELNLTGRVESIGVLADQGADGRQRGKFFRVTISLDQSDPRLRPGMTARVNIICQEESDVLVIPSFALFREGDQNFAYVQSGRGFERREIAVGARSEELVEIQKGLEPGEHVALSRPPHDRVLRTRYF